MTERNLLIVDDNETILTIATSLLRNKVKVFPTLNTATALRILEKKKIDLILLDVEMPDKNGFDFLLELENIDTYKKIPVVFLTGSSGQNFESRLKQSTARGFIKKPIDAASFFETIEGYL